ncbi:WecB/TagA/CpsF family glycosyltransferase [Novosphingobium sp. MW5]|nr:WecB/TagA/CpsF family glycosyltransferase [Novosphingobium sp. MW5]
MPGLLGTGPSIEFLSLRFDLVDQPAAIDALRTLAGQARFSYLITPNVDHLVQLHANRNDARVWDSYRDADLCVCDSRVLQALARPLGIDLTVLPGSDLTQKLLDMGESAFDDIAVIGGDADLIERLRSRYPRLTWRAHFPPMGVLSNASAQEEIARFVETVPSKLVIFAIGAPQSEVCCHLIAKRGRARCVAICTGASLEFLAGLKTRAPLWMQRARLEWLHRLATEPRRLWRRYLVKGPRILAIILREHVLRR